MTSSDETIESLMASLLDWASEQRTNEAAESRIRERWIRQQAAESSSMSGIALDLAEGRSSVAVRTKGGRVHHGHIETVGRDFLVIRSSSGRPTFIALDSVLWLRPDPGLVGDGAGSRDAPLDVSMADVLVRLSGDRPRLQITAGGENLSGELRTVGHDVVTLRLEGDPPASVHIRLDLVAEVSPL